MQVEIVTEVLIFGPHEDSLGKFTDGALEGRRISMINVDVYALARHLGRRFRKAQASSIRHA